MLMKVVSLDYFSMIIIFNIGSFLFLRISIVFVCVTEKWCHTENDHLMFSYLKSDVRLVSSSIDKYLNETIEIFSSMLIVKTTANFPLMPCLKQINTIDSFLLLFLQGSCTLDVKKLKHFH